MSTHSEPINLRTALMVTLPLVVLMSASLTAASLTTAASPVFCPPDQAVCTSRISSPKWNGFALDWCKVFENQCGKPAADEYCKLKGYANALSYTGPVRVAPPAKTVVATSGAICQAPHVCDTFSSITCQTYPHFHKPKYTGIPLDWCKTFERDCGKPAADKYCQLKGFASAAAFSGPVRLPSDTVTIVASTGAVCHTPHVCDTFAWIACKK